MADAGRWYKEEPARLGEPGAFWPYHEEAEGGRDAPRLLPMLRASLHGLVLTAECGRSRALDGRVGRKGEQRRGVTQEQWEAGGRT